MKNLVRAVLTSLVSVLALHLSCAYASEAPDLTLKCEFDVFSGKQSFSQCLDGDYRTYWSTNKGGSDALLEIRVPEGQHASGIWMQWYDQPHAWSVWVQDQEGTWQEHSHTDGAYLSEFLTLPENTTAFRLANAPGERKRFYLADMHIYGEGELPAMEFVNRGMNAFVLSYTTDITMSVPLKKQPLEDISSLYETSNSRLYENYYVPWGTSSFLFYGVEPPYGTHAEGSVDFKKENGSIIAEGLGTRLPSQITFSPDPMMDAAAQTQFSTRLQEIADFLTDIAATSDYAYDHSNYYSYVPIHGPRVYRPTVYFNDSASWPDDNALLTNAFNAYTNNGEILAGSTAGINSLLTMLYRAARAQYDNTTYYVSYYRNTTSTYSQGEYYYVREMCRNIIEAFGSSSLVSVTNPTSASSASVSLNAPYDDIPGQYGIPAGAASFRYDYAQKKFIPGINDTGAALTAVNDTREDVQVLVRWKVCRADGSETDLQGEEALTVPAFSAVPLQKLSFPGLDPRKHFLSYAMSRDGETVSASTVLFCPPKYFPFEDPELSVVQDGEYLTVRAKRYARMVEINGADGDAVLSDNDFDMLPGEKIVRIVKGGATRWTVRSVYDIK